MATKTAAQKAADIQTAGDAKTADDQKAAEATITANNAADSASGNDPAEGDEKAITGVADSGPKVTGADAIADAASPTGVDTPAGTAAFRPPATKHQPWTINTLAESEGGSALGVEQTSGNADVTKDPADRPDADATA